MIFYYFISTLCWMYYYGTSAVDELCFNMVSWKPLHNLSLFTNLRQLGTTLSSPMCCHFLMCFSQFSCPDKWMLLHWIVLSSIIIPTNNKYHIHGGPPIILPDPPSYTSFELTPIPIWCIQLLSTIGWIWSTIIRSSYPSHSHYLSD